MSDILEALQTLLYNGLPQKAILPIVNDLLEVNEFEDDDDCRVLALVAGRAEWENDVDLDVAVTTYDDCQFEVGGNTYMVLDEDERESRWDDALENYLDECVEGADGPYFDRDAWKRDARFDGAAHTLGSYDGGEIEVSVKDGWFWIYRTN
jgi:hypothetical protein